MIEVIINHTSEPILHLGISKYNSNGLVSVVNTLSLGNESLLGNVKGEGELGNWFIKVCALIYFCETKLRSKSINNITHLAKHPKKSILVKRFFKGSNFVITCILEFNR
jgi:hypothetical protein